MLVGLLDIPRGDIVGHGVAEDHLGDAVDGHQPTDAPDHHGQFALELQVVGLHRLDDGAVGTDHTRIGLEEDQRVGVDGVAQLGGMGGIVASHAHDLAARDHGGEQSHLGQGVPFSGEVDGPRQGITGECCDRIGVISPVIDEFHEAIGRISSRAGITSNTHEPNLPVGPPGGLGVPGSPGDYSSAPKPFNKPNR